MTRALLPLDPEAVIGLNLRHLREDAGLTLSQLSARLGLSADRLAEIEAGDEEPLTTELRLFRRALNCRLEALFAPPRAERLLS